MQIIQVIGFVAALISVASAASGTASYNTAPYVPTSCKGVQSDGVMIAAASNAIWSNGAACGRNYRVTCTGRTNPGVLEPCRGSAVVKIVEYCPACRGTFELSQEAFAMIADLAAGVVEIDYQLY